MAQEHLNNLISQTGLEAADIEAILALPAEGEHDLTAYTGKIHTAAESKLKNDPDFWEKLDETNVNPAFQKRIESQQYGRAANIVRQKALKALGLKEEDLGELTDDDKKSVETYIGKAAEKFASSKVSDQQLQADLLAARKKVEELELDIPTRETKIKADYETEYSNKTLDLIILAELAGIEGLKVPAHYVAKEMAATLKEENAFAVNGLKATPKQKANPNLDVLEGSKALTLKDLIVKKLTADGLIEKAPAAGSKKGSTVVDVDPDGNGGLGISSHILDKIKENAPTA